MSKSTRVKAVPKEEVKPIDESKVKVESDKAEIVEKFFNTGVIVKDEPKKVEEPTVIIFTPKEKTAELKPVGVTFEERLLDYVSKCGGETMINDFLRIEYKELLNQQETAKRIGLALKKLVDSGKIIVEGNYARLGKFFYQDGNTETQYYTPQNTKLTVKSV